ncbi:hypothetical protein [Dethiosulfatarculus sandiegensis]|uniref:Lipoprotein n=1 Tax=Dethiosulfatarculus sandiegensis TaxID=1429043 RepID=A0A0D2JU55_9BACT|nr:hypothetical protein [Dethiosulfatarculus sandiegensis]KIX12995.1 hypothetical protein X474_16235 [Dethiosulfatarculus sandiegensis]
MKRYLCVISALFLMMLFAGCGKNVWEMVSHSKEGAYKEVPIEEISADELIGKHKYSYHGSGQGSVKIAAKNGKPRVVGRGWNSDYLEDVGMERNRVWKDYGKLYITHNFHDHAYTWILEKAYCLEDGSLALVGRATWPGGDYELVITLADSKRCKIEIY